MESRTVILEDFRLPSGFHPPRPASSTPTRSTSRRRCSHDADWTSSRVEKEVVVAWRSSASG